MCAAQSHPLLAALLFSLTLTACGGGGGDDPEPVAADPAPAAPDPAPSDDDASLASGGCSNAVIVDGFAYGACGTEIEVVSLADLSRSLISVVANDIAADPANGLLFTQAGTSLNLLSLADPAAPVLQDSATTNFSAFSGISAANGVLVVSAGAGSADTQVYTYTDTDLTLATDGIAELDSAVGNPDVHVVPTATGITAYYSQDIGAVANFAIQPVELGTNGEVLSVLPDVVLTPRAFDSNSAFSPANFPVESEFLADQLFVANFAADGIEVIDIANNNALLASIPLFYEPTNITTDGALLFVVGLTNATVDIIDPATASVTGSLTPAVPFAQPVGVAASLTHVAVADRTNGLVVIAR